RHCACESPDSALRIIASISSAESVYDPSQRPGNSGSLSSSCCAMTAGDINATTANIKNHGREVHFDGVAWLMRNVCLCNRVGGQTKGMPTVHRVRRLNSTVKTPRGWANLLQHWPQFPRMQLRKRVLIRRFTDERCPKAVNQEVGDSLAPSACSHAKSRCDARTF